MTNIKHLRAGMLAAALVIVGALGMPTHALADAKHHIVIQVSTDDALTQKIALNNASNLMKEMGDDVEIEVVAYGPGMSLFTKNGSPESPRVPDLSLHHNMTFSACGNTIKGITKKTGKEPTLVDGVRVVPAGVVRIMELQEQGWSYIRP